MDAQQEAPQETMCHIALLQPLEQCLFPIVLPLFGTLFPLNYKKQVLLIVLKGSTWNCYQILILPMLWTLRSIVLIVSRLYPTPLPRPISIQYSVTWRPTSSLSPCDTTIHLFALGPISVFVSRYTWYEYAAGREKQSQNLIEKTYSWTCCTTAMTCQGPRIHLSGPATWKWALLGTTLKKKKKKKERAWQKERNKRCKWEMTENAQFDKENIWALLDGHFFKVHCNVKSAVVVRLCLPFNWSMTTASLPWSTENSKTAVTGVFSCPVNVERDVEDGC